MNAGTRKFVLGVAVGFAAAYVWSNYADTAAVRRTT